MPLFDFNCNLRFMELQRQFIQIVEQQSGSSELLPEVANHENGNEKIRGASETIVVKYINQQSPLYSATVSHLNTTGVETIARI